MEKLIDEIREALIDIEKYKSIDMNTQLSMIQLKAVKYALRRIVNRMML